ncbi:hypothetical protein AVEN_181371-1 [Araneus ventricosus]|uniref:Uncharacterized protein n=1 Tax=Araneus ventricosus TaxID=182803 RepID=A0A4Y2WZ63_ARAVE|nr:hypothetical protein AVEN_181371-1 [Araneus ventricosus]
MERYQQSFFHGLRTRTTTAASVSEIDCEIDGGLQLLYAKRLNFLTKQTVVERVSFHCDARALSHRKKRWIEFGHARICLHTSSAFVRVIGEINRQYCFDAVNGSLD